MLSTFSSNTDLSFGATNCCIEPVAFWGMHCYAESIIDLSLRRVQVGMDLFSLIIRYTGNITDFLLSLKCFLMSIRDGCRVSCQVQSKKKLHLSSSSWLKGCFWLSTNQTFQADEAVLIHLFYKSQISVTGAEALFKLRTEPGSGAWGGESAISLIRWQHTFCSATIQLSTSMDCGVVCNSDTIDWRAADSLSRDHPRN